MPRERGESAKSSQEARADPHAGAPAGAAKRYERGWASGHARHRGARAAATGEEAIEAEGRGRRDGWV